jgi:hypothetical protein
MHRNKYRSAQYQEAQKEGGFPRQIPDPVAVHGEEQAVVVHALEEGLFRLQVVEAVEDTSLDWRHGGVECCCVRCTEEASGKTGRKCLAEGQKRWGIEEEQLTANWIPAAS